MSASLPAPALLQQHGSPSQAFQNAGRTHTSAYSNATRTPTLKDHRKNPSRVPMDVDPPPWASIHVMRRLRSVRRPASGRNCQSGRFGCTTRLTFRSSAYQAWARSARAPSRRQHRDHRIPIETADAVTIRENIATWRQIQTATRGSCGDGRASSAFGGFGIQRTIGVRRRGTGKG